MRYLAFALLAAGLFAAAPVARAQVSPADSLGVGSLERGLRLSPSAPAWRAVPAWRVRTDFAQSSLASKVLGLTLGTVLFNHALRRAGVDHADISRIDRIPYRSQPPAAYEPPIPLPPSAEHPPCDVGFLLCP